MTIVRYAYGVTALLLLSGSAFALSTGDPGPAAAMQGPVTIAQSGLAPRGAPNSFADLAAQLQPAVVNIATKQKVQVATSFNPFTGERRPVTGERRPGTPTHGRQTSERDDERSLLRTTRERRRRELPGRRVLDF